MSPKTDEGREEAVLVLAPTGRDAALATAVLEEHGFRAVVCPDVAALCRELDAGAGAVLLAEEALAAPPVGCLIERLRQQPAWSDLPLVVFGGGDPGAAASRRTIAAIAPLGNVTVVDRPVRIVALVSALRAALRARRRQYEVRDLLARLSRSVQDRDHFLAMLGHELRNPLAAIVYGLQVLDKAGGLDEQARRPFEVIERQSRYLARLVDDLLDVSRVTSGRMRLLREPVDVVALVERSADTEGTTTEAQGIDIEIVADPGPMFVEGDPVRLKQIVNNLVTNALKYTPAGGRVRVSVARAGDRAVITVQDTGVGIAQEMLGRIFEPFTQVEDSIDRARGGLGLGLSVVHGLVELHGGTVTAESPGLGQGSRFTVTLPLSAAAPTPAPPGGPGPRPSAALRVILIEDNADQRELLKDLLAASGHHVGVAADGPSGLAAVLAEEPDAALVDIGLPGLDGYEVARAVRAALGERVYLAALSGYGQPEDQRRAKEAGFDAHLTKPVRLAAVKALLGEAAERRA